MSVQCKNCVYCLASIGKCGLYYNKRVIVPLKVNINKQRVCVHFRKRNEDKKYE